MVFVRPLRQLHRQFSEVLIHTACKLLPKKFLAILQSENPPILLEIYHWPCGFPGNSVPGHHRPPPFFTVDWEQSGWNTSFGSLKTTVRQRKLLFSTAQEINSDGPYTNPNDLKHLSVKAEVFELQIFLRILSTDSFCWQIVLRVFNKLRSNFECRSSRVLSNNSK